MLFNVTAEEVTDIYRTLEKIGCLGDSPSAGYLRAAYSDEETQAMKFIEAEAKKLGAVARWDAVGNLALDWPGVSPQFVETGSHIDTVPNGGNFDGAVGVVSGLLAIAAIRRSNKNCRHGLRLRIWRAEESSTYNVLYGGSRAAFGQLDPACLTYTFQGRSYADAMLSQQADPEIIRSKRCTISQQEIDAIRAHVEIHIEQGRLLESSGTDIAIVTSIRAPRRYRIILNGDFDHSGGTPMGVEHRRDVNLAMAYMQVELDKLCNQAIAKGDDLVQTIGVINSSPDFNKANPLIHANAVPIISGFGYFSLEIRSNRAAILQQYSAQAEALIKQLAEKFRVKVEIQLLSSSTPLEHMDADIQKTMQDCAQKANISAMHLPSGAGHDTAVVGIQKKSDGSTIPVGMLFIPCRDGKSHCPEEYVSAEAIAKGATVLANGLYELANG